MKSKNYILHNYLFTFGFIYYLIFPFLIANSEFIGEYEQYNLFIDNYNKSYNTLYITLMITYYFSFIFGSKFYLTFFKKKINYVVNQSIFFFETIIVILFIILNILYTYFNKSLFIGYADEYGDSFTRGLFTTFQVLLTFIFIFYKVNNKNSKLLLFLVIENSIVLFGLGSRLYVLFSIISYMIFLFIMKRLKVTKTVGYGFVILFLLVVVGAYRSSTNIDRGLITFYFVAEANFSWISVSSMLNLNSEFKMLSYPSNYLSSFINFLPSFIFTDKSSLIISSKELINYETPVGATNVLVSSIANFGLLGTAFFFFFTGAFYSYIFSKIKSGFLFVYYITICAILPFQFFRDNFAILNKMIYYNLFLLPYMLFEFNRLIYKKK